MRTMRSSRLLMSRSKIVINRSSSFRSWIFFNMLQIDNILVRCSESYLFLAIFELAEQFFQDDYIRHFVVLKHNTKNLNREEQRISEKHGVRGRTTWSCNFLRFSIFSRKSIWARSSWSWLAIRFAALSLNRHEMNFFARLISSSFRRCLSIISFTRTNKISKRNHELHQMLKGKWRTCMVWIQIFFPVEHSLTLRTASTSK